MEEEVYKKYKKISFILAVFVGIVIFAWSSVSGAGGPGISIAFLPVLYHLGMFGLLNGFLFLATGMKKNFIGIVFFISFIYACLDEIHQAFVPGRTCGWFDLGIDFVGILGSFVFIWIFTATRK